MLCIIASLLGHAADSPMLSHFPLLSVPDQEEPVLTHTSYSSTLKMLSSCVRTRSSLQIKIGSDGLSAMRTEKMPSSGLPCHCVQEQTGALSKLKSRASIQEQRRTIGDFLRTDLARLVEVQATGTMTSRRDLGEYVCKFTLIASFLKKKGRLSKGEHEYKFVEGFCHGSTGSPSALLRRVLRGGVTVLEGAGVLARGTGSCT